MVNILFWNTRGTLNAGFRRTIMDLIKNHRPDILVLLETKISGNKADSVINSLGYANHMKSDAIGFRGGIWISWSDACLNIELRYSCTQLIHTLVTENNGDKWFFSAIYASPRLNERLCLFNSLYTSSLNNNHPWLLVGDFNELGAFGDKTGHITNLDNRRVARFCEWLNLTGLLDLGFSGPPYTWAKKCNGRTVLRERIDKALSNIQWKNLFPNTTVVHLPHTHSDHRPILLITNPHTSSQHSPPPFRFQRMWLTHSDLPSIIHQNWSNSTDLVNNVHSVTTALKAWNRDSFGNLFSQKRRLLRRLAGVQKTLAHSPTRGLYELEEKLISEYNTILAREVIFWKQKARNDWLNLGDQNTKFFHASALMKRNRGKVSALKYPSGQWTYDEINIKNMILNHFRHIYSKEDRPSNLSPLPKGFPRIQESDLTRICRPVNEAEIKKAVFSFSPWKTPGPDGLQAGFFQKFWNQISPSICSFIKTTFQTGTFDENINHSFITLVPKRTPIETVNDFRPISLCNTTLKIITSIIAERFRPMMQKMISDTQASFLPERMAGDNIILVNEILHTMRHSKAKNGYMALKVDLEKAFDRLNWDFIRETLFEVGLPSSIITLIMHCITTPQMSVLWEGKATEFFSPTRGVRQGDPLSPFIFILCIERLSHLINSKVENGDWKSIKISKNGPSFSHLFYADDLFLFGKASTKNLSVILECLNLFCAHSGQNVNHQKSKIFCSPSTPRQLKNLLREMSGFTLTEDLGKYLGSPTYQGRLSKDTFKSLMDSTINRLSGWKKNRLSMAGRACLINSVMTSLPNHIMQTVTLPRGVINFLEKIYRLFLGLSS